MKNSKDFSINIEYSRLFLGTFFAPGMNDKRYVGIDIQGLNLRGVTTLWINVADVDRLYVDLDRMIAIDNASDDGKDIPIED